jgi:hypothetical protein
MVASFLSHATPRCRCDARFLTASPTKRKPFSEQRLEQNPPAQLLYDVHGSEQKPKVKQRIIQSCLLDGVATIEYLRRTTIRSVGCPHRLLPPPDDFSAGD